MEKKIATNQRNSDRMSQTWDAPNSQETSTGRRPTLEEHWERKMHVALLVGQFYVTGGRKNKLDTGKKKNEAENEEPED